MLKVLRPFEESFWAKVDRRDMDECWEWTACRNSFGYGSCRVSGKTVASHRIAWMLQNGEIADGLCVLHRCDNPPCCNPGHLFLGSRADNNHDCFAKGRNNPKLSKNDIVEIKTKYFDGKISQQEIADQYGVGRKYISKIVKGDRWNWAFDPPNIALIKKREKLSNEQVAEIRSLCDTGERSAASIGREYGVSGTHVLQISKGITRRCL